MNIDIVQPNKKVLSGEVTSVKLPGTDGSFQVLNNHANLIASLGNGEVTVVTASGESKTIQISGGVVEVLENKLSVLAESVIEK